MVTYGEPSQDERNAVGDEGLRLRPQRPWLGPHLPFLRRVARPVVDFFQVEAVGGIVLIAAALVALAWANSPWEGSYQDFWTTTITLRWGRVRAQRGHPALGQRRPHGAVLLRGRAGDQRRDGERRASRASPRSPSYQRRLGGLAAPAAIYLAVNLRGGTLEGWGLPVATDIAFAIGVLALLGDRVPQSLKVFFLAVAIVDDVGAVLLIALFYSGSLSLTWLGTAVALLVVIVVLRWLRVWYVPAYALLGCVVWLATFKSGVHATTAGVALGLLAPSRPLVTPEQDRLTRFTAGPPRWCSPRPADRPPAPGARDGRRRRRRQGDARPLPGVGQRHRGPDPPRRRPPLAYDEGGKIPLVTPYETTATVTVTEYVPASAPEAPEGLLVAMLRNAFSLNRARALPLDGVRLEGEGIVVATRADRVARIRPAGPDTLPELERWDTFVLTVLDAEEEVALDQVEGDSWWGRWA